MLHLMPMYGTPSGYVIGVGTLLRIVIIFALLFPPAYGIAENIRYREWSWWPYLTMAAVYTALGLFAIVV